jgi:hypothetical protein
MISCPNCKHQNPQAATNCEACYTALPATKACPACGASIQLDATFCGQCGQNLNALESKVTTPSVTANPTPEPANIGLPPTVLTIAADEIEGNLIVPAVTVQPDVLVEPVVAEELAPLPIEPAPVPIVPKQSIEVAIPDPVITELSAAGHQLLHLQTNTTIEIPPQLQIIHLGKPNDQIPPDIDVSGFPCAEVVSRVHANIRVEEENYYIEDVGSANGTYINHNILTKGNRHLLRTGDRIGLGKGDLVTFIFQ